MSKMTSWWRVQEPEKTEEEAVEEQKIGESLDAVASEGPRLVRCSLSKITFLWCFFREFLCKILIQNAGEFGENYLKFR